MTHLPYRVIFCEVDTGIVLNADVSRYLNTQASPRWEARLDSLDEALALKDRLLSQFPHTEVTILGGPDGFQSQCFAGR